MKLITLTHANTADLVTVFVGKIFYIYESRAGKATHVVSDGGSFFPATENKAEILRRIDAATNVALEATSNGNEKAGS